MSFKIGDKVTIAPDDTLENVENWRGKIGEIKYTYTSSASAGLVHVYFSDLESSTDEGLYWFYSHELVKNEQCTSVNGNPD